MNPAHPAGSHGVRNPFCLPGQEANPYQPLQAPEHERFYVDVDRTREAFEQFRRVGQSGDLVTQGRLVVVSGMKGSGKTSLIRRCAAALRTSSAQEDTGVVIADLTGLGAGMTIPDRLQAVAQELVDILEDETGLGPEALSPLRDVGVTPERLYRKLSRLLNAAARRGDGSLLVAVQLPASDARSAEEMAAYALLTSPRVVFFAESPYLHLQPGWESKLSSSAPTLPLMLHLGPLKEADCGIFAANRFAEDDVASAPPIEEVAMRWLDQYHGALTLERLQKLLHGVYEWVLGMPDLPDSVTRQHFNDYMLNHWAPQVGQS